MEDKENVESTPVALRLRCDVYLSLNAEDKGKTFGISLSESLEKAGFRVFRNEDGLIPDESRASELLDAIQDSAASIVIISPKYADCWWCLEEMAKICECQRLILPVFYDVDPSNVRHQRGPFAAAFRSHGEIESNNVERWRKAMAKSGGIAGCVFNKDSTEAELINDITKRVITELSNTPQFVASYIVGLDSRVKNVMELLNVKSNETRVLGLHGIGGVGKTTLAKALFNKLTSHFKRRSFIFDIRETAAKANGLIALQNELIKQLSPQRKPVNEVSAGRKEIQDICSSDNEEPVLIVLDDVSDVCQLEALADSRKWFCEGSKIIITTRDTEVLSHNLVSIQYEVRELDVPQALQLFSHHALKREKPTENFLSLSEKIVSLTGGLPLALEVFGSYLSDKRNLKEWEDALQKLKRIRPVSLQDVLKISFDALKEETKCVFLDIACLFVKMDMKREDAIDIWKGCGFEAEKTVITLVAKSLIKITEGDRFWLHDQVRDMGRQISQQGKLNDPSAQSRLWNRDDIMNVLKNNKGSRWIEGIVLDIEKRNQKGDVSGGRISWDNLQRNPNISSAITYIKASYREHMENREEKKNEVIICTKPFEKMIDMRLLQINNAHLEGKFGFLPDKLKWLQWKGCPLKTLPPDFCPRELAVLDLSESTNIERLWDTFCCKFCFECNDKVGENLMVMNLRGCVKLAVLPNLSGQQRLEKLVLEHCINLKVIHESIGKLSVLSHLNLTECSNLIELPSDVCNLKKLESLILSGCSKLKQLPANIGSMESLKTLDASKTAIEKLPESLSLLKNLAILNFSHCQSLKVLAPSIGNLSSLVELFLDRSGVEEIPETIRSLSNLQKLDLGWCASLTAVPGSIGELNSLENFVVYGCKIEELPASIGSLSNLKDLSLGKGKYMSRLPDSLRLLDSITVLSIEETSIKDLPHEIGDLKTLKKLEMIRCRSLERLPNSIGGLVALTRLNIYDASIEELPEPFGKLENLITLRLNKCKRLHKLPISMGNLRSLHHLYMEETKVTQLPESFGMLSNLMVLKMAKKRPLDAQEENEIVVLPNTFANLSSLIEFDARECNISGRFPDDFEKLSELEVLSLGRNCILGLPSSMKGQSVLKKLLLPNCKELKSLPPLPSSLTEINVANCISLEDIADLSDLKSLQDLNLTNCERVEDIPGLEELKSLKRLYMGNCHTCSSLVKRRLSKVTLRNIRNLSMPGSKIPDWFSQEKVTFSNQKNRDLKGVVIGVVVSLNHDEPDYFIEALPALVDIQAQVLKLDFYSIFDTVLYLLGVPYSNEDQVYLCRYPVSHPLLALLKDGYKINVRKREPPHMKGIELKSYGIHLVFDGDDDYDGDEDSLNENQQSLSERLANFFNTCGEDR